MKGLRALVPPHPSGVGTDPDYRFTFANERTFLAWIRTSLALTAGGLGAVHLLPDLFAREVIGIGLLVLGLATAASSYRRWVHNEIAMRLDTPLPESRLPMLLAVGAAIVGVVAVVLVVVDALR